MSHLDDCIDDLLPPIKVGVPDIQQDACAPGHRVVDVRVDVPGAGRGHREGGACNRDTSKFPVKHLASLYRNCEMDIEYVRRSHSTMGGVMTA